ncbi:MAG: cupin domain-containing protein [Geodermatophilaceae bacterium]|nr:cupin domain-containing protein [Geodermatophilaceae bacterium]
MIGSATPTATVRAQGEGQRRWFFGGGVHTWKATEEETGGAFLLFEVEMALGKQTPLHIHPESDETMYVVAGEILMHLDGAEHRIGAGGTVVAPRGVPHAFLVLTDATRLLCLHTPGCCQAFYFGASEPLEDGTTVSGVVDMARVQASARENGEIEILGPPPFPAP